MAAPAPTLRGLKQCLDAHGLVFQDVLALIGAIGGGMLAFVMPPLAYLNLYAPP